MCQPDTQKRRRGWEKGEEVEGLSLHSEKDETPATSPTMTKAP